MKHYLRQISFPVFVLILALFLGCTTPDPDAAAMRTDVVDLPEWVTKPPIEDGAVFGIGQDFDLKIAKSKSIISIGQTLNTSVLSILEEKVVSDDHGTSIYVSSIMDMVTDEDVIGAKFFDQFQDINGYYWVLARAPEECIMDAIEGVLLSYRMELKQDVEAINGILNDIQSTMSSELKDNWSSEYYPVGIIWNNQPRFHWPKAAGADHYELRISRDIAFTNMESYFVSNNGFIYDADGDRDTIYWQVRPIQGREEWEWSEIMAYSARKIVAIDFGRELYFCIDNAGDVWAWGKLSDYHYTPTRLNGISEVKAVSVGEYHALLQKEDGSLWSWGNTGYANSANNDDSSVNRFKLLSEENDWIKISAGTFDSYGIRRNGDLYGWDGYNEEEQFDSGFRSSRYQEFPTFISSGWIDVVSRGHTLGIKKDGSRWGWGADEPFEVLFAEERGTPLTMIRIGEENDWLHFYLGGFFSVGQKNDGSFWSWGNNNFGQLGISGAFRVFRDPIQIPMESSWVQVSPGHFHCIAVGEDGTLWGWGSVKGLGLGDSSGNEIQIVDYGFGPQSVIPYPVRIGTESDWQQVSAENHSSMALKSDGSVWIWGNNLYGHQTANSSDPPYLSPVRVLFPELPEVELK